MLLTEAEVRRAAKSAVDTVHKSATTILKEEARTARTHFDIFLSHTIKDAEIVLGVKKILEASGKTVYVDWIDDPQADRENVTPETARLLRGRMDQSLALFYLHSAQSGKSKWMPWELGYFDGHNGNVAILPVVAKPGETFKGQEYLGLYPYVDFVNLNSTRPTAFVNRGRDHKTVVDWIIGSDKLRPAA